MIQLSPRGRFVDVPLGYDPAQLAEIDGTLFHTTGSNKFRLEDLLEHNKFRVAKNSPILRVIDAIRDFAKSHPHVQDLQRAAKKKFTLIDKTQTSYFTRTGKISDVTKFIQEHPNIILFDPDVVGDNTIWTVTYGEQFLLREIEGQQEYFKSKINRKLLEQQPKKTENDTSCTIL